jgi:hypothetical protein
MIPVIVWILNIILGKKIVSEIGKALDNTLKDKDTGRYSRKSVTMFFGSIFFFCAGWVIIYMKPEYAIEVFYGYGLMATGQTVMTLVDKKGLLTNTVPNAPQKGQAQEPIEQIPPN